MDLSSLRQGVTLGEVDLSSLHHRELKTRTFTQISLHVLARQKGVCCRRENQAPTQTFIPVNAQNTSSLAFSARDN